MDNDFMLTTSDNPYNPWTDYEQWLVYDAQAGYNMPGYVARIYNEKLPESSIEFDNDDVYLAAMLEVLEQNIYGNIIPIFKPKDADDSDPDEE